MTARAIAFCLALLLCWTGLAMPDSPVRAGPAASSEEGVLAVHTADEHRAQAQAESATDLQALLPQSACAMNLARGAMRAWPWASAALPAPVLDGPRRPPRSAHATA